MKAKSPTPTVCEIFVIVGIPQRLLIMRQDAPESPSDRLAADAAIAFGGHAILDIDQCKFDVGARQMALRWGSIPCSQTGEE
jgi:hypothetical protein